MDSLTSGMADANRTCLYAKGMADLTIYCCVVRQRLVRPVRTFERFLNHA